MPKLMPIRTLSVYSAVQTEMEHICRSFDQLSDLPDKPFGDKTLKDAAKRLRGRTADFIAQELSLVEETDYLPKPETDNYFSDGIALYDSAVWANPLAGAKYLYTRWVVNYMFLARRICEYQYGDLDPATAAKLVDRYGLHLVGTHEAVVKSGLAKYAQARVKRL